MAIRYMNKKGLFVHRDIAEKALGRQLPREVHVHHVNGDAFDNRNENLVICQNAAYHGLLHRRQAAMDACGNPNWHKCRFCGEYDAPENLYIKEGPPHGFSAKHRKCAAEYQVARRARLNQTA